MERVELLATRCAICGTVGNASELYTANFDWQAFNPVIFSARRLPDQIHYRIVKCTTCGLVRSDPVAPAELLNHLYARSDLNYNDELANLKWTYGYYLRRLSDYGTSKEKLLEIGCGNGFFLEEALAQGYRNVSGVEPSMAAVSKAVSHIRPKIICDVFRPGLFASEQFDAICMFQVFDHVPNPGELIDECFNLLKPGGLILCLNHNVEALLAKLLKERSPIIDIEHTYLYSSDSIKRLFEAHHFQVKIVGTVFNRYTVHYLTRLAPLPIFLKRIVLTGLKYTLVGKIPLLMPLGNLYMIAQKPNKS